MKTYDLQLERTISASPAEVYAAWLDPACPATPWHGAKKLVLDPKPEALFYFVQGKQEDWAHYGQFRTLKRGEKLEYTWMSPFTNGLESVVTVTFEPKGKDTRLTLRHANIPDDENGHAHESGWRQLLQKLDEKFSR